MIELHERAVDTRRPDALALAIADELDYPILVVDEALALRLVNRVARLRLQRGAPLVVEDGLLQVNAAAGAAKLRDAIVAAAQRGLRRLVVLNAGAADETAVSVLPCTPASERQAMLIVARGACCQELTVHGYARDRGLTPMETGVLRALCAGDTPQGIARERGVRLSTVRTQIHALRAKTGSADIRALVRKVATLPPVVSKLGLVGSSSP